MGVLGVPFAPMFLVVRSNIESSEGLRKQASVMERRRVKSCHYSDELFDVKDCSGNSTISIFYRFVTG
jgi:hypothetical protein